MTERYDTATAKHYAAYRPPLHRLILEKTLDRSESFRSALDVGCGTGYSSLALVPFSDRICGIDNSEEMLNLAEKHPKISYKFGDVDSLSDLTDQPFDIVTFAGSLVYTKSPKLREAWQ